MILNKYGKIAYLEWLRTAVLRPNMELGAFIIMPNHMHALIKIMSSSTIRSGVFPFLMHLPIEIKTSPININSSGELHSPDSPSLIYAESMNNHHSIHAESNDLKSILDFVRGDCKSPLRGPSQTIGAVVRGYKSAVTKQLGSLGFHEKLWQRNYYDCIIRDMKSYHIFSNYIRNNPAKWHQKMINKK